MFSISKYDIISNFLFPKFNQPKESRFKIFFSSIQNVPQKAKTNNYSISIEKIESGEDKRTTVLIKNIPNFISKDIFLKVLEGIGNINYLYLPFNKFTCKNLGYAFVNVVNYKNIINLYNRLTHYDFDEFEVGKSIEISYYKIQGRSNLCKMFLKNKFNYLNY